MNISTAVYVSLGLSSLSLAAVMAGLWQIRSLNSLRQTFFSGSTGKDLEHVITTLVQNINNLGEQQRIAENEIVRFKHNLNFAVQKVGVVRFNPFADGGGNFSFCLALLDGMDTGLVITSMHGREQNRIYTKKILQGGSESALTEEEKEAVISAIESHKKQIK